MSTTVECFGYTWITDSQPLPPGLYAPPAPNLPAYNSNMWQPQNVQVSGGTMQLTLARNSGYVWNNGFQPSSGPDQIWAAAQAVLQLPAGQQLTYGAFLVTVEPVGGWGPFVGGDTAPGQNTSTIFGAFTFDTAAPAPFSEMDVVEIGYQNQNSAGAWINQQPGGPPNSNAQFAVQPWDAGNPGQPNWSYVRRVMLDPGSGPVTITMEWLPGRPLSWAASWGGGPPAVTWQTPPSTPIPALSPTMTFYLNLWPYGGPTTNQPVTFNVTNVQLPVGTG